MRDETKCLHAGYHPKNAEPRVVPIGQSLSLIHIFEQVQESINNAIEQLKNEGYIEGE